MDKKNIETIYSLSPTQQGMLYETVSAPEPGIHIEQLILTLKGVLDTTALYQAWQWAIERHAILRTSFVWESQVEPLQVVMRRVDVPYELQDWRMFLLQEQGRHLETYLEEDRVRGFKLARAPLMRLALFQTADDGYQFVWTYHHILMDGWCAHLVMKEVLACYQARRDGREFTLEQSRPYRDYIAWLKKQDMAKAEHFWREMLHSYNVPTALGREEKPVSLLQQEHGYGMQKMTISAPTTFELQALSSQHRITSNTLLQGIWALLLSRYSEKQDVVFGITVSGRPAELAGSEKMVGLCINTLPVRTKLEARAPFWSWLADLQTYNLEMRDYEYSPGGLVRQWSAMPGAYPLYESLFVVENYPVDKTMFEASALHFSVTNVRSQGAQTKYALTILVILGPVWEIRCIYDHRRFDDASIGHILAHFQLLLTLLADGTAQTIAELWEQVPAHTIPRVKALPKNLSGIVVPPRNPIEEVLVGIWKELLGREQISISDNFFELGGHSLLATQFASRIYGSLQVAIPLRIIFEAPTIAQLATRITTLKYAQASPPMLPIVPLPRSSSHFPLSFAQQRLWFLEQLLPGRSSYTIIRPFRLQGTLYMQALQQSLQEIMYRHETLRTSFTTIDDEVVQVIARPQTLIIPVIDMQALTGHEAEVLHQISEDLRRPFDLTRGPLIRIRVFRQSTDEHILLITVHHILFDAWSEGVLMRELSILYAAYTTGLPSPLAILPVQYADFAVGQRAWLQGEVLEAQIAYWRKQLYEATALELPVRRSATALRSAHGALMGFQLSAQLSDSLVALSRREGTTLFMLLLTAFQTFLYRYTGKEDIVIGTDIANRVHIETEGMIGFFVNLLALRTRFYGNPRFCDVLRQVREVVLDACAHQDLPFEQIVNVCHLERKANQIPLIRVLFVFQNAPMIPLQMQGLVIRPVEIEMHTTNFDLAVFLREEAGILSGAVNYSTDLFDVETITTIFQQFKVLLHDVIAHPDSKVNALEIHSEDEKQLQHLDSTKREHKLRQHLKISRRTDIDLSE